MGHDHLVTFDRVGFSYPGKPMLFHDLSFHFSQGVFHVIRGPSGSGKSTLLRLVNRLEEPQEGNIFFKSRTLPSYHPPLLRRSILYIQQTPTVVDGAVRNNLLLPFGFKNNQALPRPQDSQLQELLDTFHLQGVNLDENALGLSVGQRQRICFIRALLLSPEIFLLDEPTSALDKESGELVESMAERLCVELRKTVIMVSHRAFRPTKAAFVELEVAGGQVTEH